MPDALAATITFASPALLAAAGTAAVVTIVIAAARRISLPRSAAVLLLAALLCLSLGAGGLTWARQRIGKVAVIVDVSPSTTTATYHDHRLLAQRVEQLLRRTPFTLYLLADGVTRAKSSSLAELPEIVECRQTNYAPPGDADAVVLFTDGQLLFMPPASAQEPGGGPPTFIVLDPALDAPADSALERLELRGDSVVITLSNTADEPRTLMFIGADVESVPVDVGRLVVTARLAPEARNVHAFFNARDPWRGNDGLSLRVPAPHEAQKWWIGQRPPPDQWIHIQPAAVPVDLADYLAAGVIVLDNVPADALADIQRLRLHQYVRDLGGGLIILGGDSAFAAGGYAGSPLEQVSPLASNPPQPAVQWLILVDSSGSMARTLGNNSRWHFATNAVAQLVPLLPGDDVVSIGSFSQALRWWVAGRRAREVQAGYASPKDLRPAGPTNLATALRLIADTSDGALPTQLLIITDAEAELDDAAALADALAAKKVHVSVLASEQVPPHNPLQLIVTRTGGHITGRRDPRTWAAELKQLMRAASPTWLAREPMTVRFTEAGGDLPPQSVSIWNRTWIRRDAIELAVGETRVERVPAIAAWHVGTGAAVAAAFSPSPQIVEALADRVATPPRDPRFRVTHDAGSVLRVTLDALDDEGYMNDLAPRVDLSVDGSRSGDAATRMTQIAPGRYEAALPAPARASLATVSLRGQVIHRFAVAARYPPEYDRIGNNRAAMEVLARATGGAVFDAADASPIPFRWPTQPIPLAPWLALAGALLLGAALVQWRLR